MKLSEAIRLGAMLGPQCTGALFGGERSCAFGAAYLAVGKRREDISPNGTVSDYVPEWRWVERVTAECPVCGSRKKAIEIIASCLNDRHGWTRERIADWVATREAQADESTNVQLVDVELGREA